MSAALDTAAQFPALDAAIDITLEAPNPIDVEITIYGGLDPDTDQLITNARKAAEILSKEYGIYAVIVPQVLYWGLGTGPVTPYSLPILVINGQEVADGLVLSPEEIVEEALTRLGMQGKEEPPFITLSRRSDNRQAAVATW